jgi:hypothetical protein
LWGDYLLRDFKKFTSKKLIENLCEFEPDVLSLFKKEQGYQFWMEDNQPKIIETEQFALQKINYIQVTFGGQLENI